MSLYDAIAEHISDGRMEEEQVDFQSLRDFIAQGDGTLIAWEMIDDALDRLTEQYREYIAAKSQT